MLAHTPDGLSATFPFSLSAMSLASALTQPKLGWWAYVLMNCRTRGNAEGFIDIRKVGGAKSAAFIDPLYGLGMIELKPARASWDGHGKPTLLIRAHLPVLGSGQTVPLPRHLATLLDRLAKGEV